MSSRDRVPLHTKPSINKKIEKETRDRIDFYVRNPEQLDERLSELDKEWDIERTLEANSAILSLFGLAMGYMSSRRWFLLPAAVQSFLLQHAVQGWCPPLPVLRKYGFRTVEEIEHERTALKAIRGDFDNISTRDNYHGGQSRAIWEAVAH